MTSSISFWYWSRSILESSIFCPIQLKFGKLANFEALISNLTPKNPMQVRFEQEKGHFVRKKPTFGQALLNKTVAMAMCLVTVNLKLFQMMFYIIILKVRQSH